MQFNSVFDLKEFYETELGKFTCRNLRSAVLKIWPQISREKILGFGFALPYLPIMAYNNTCVAFMPSTIGAMQIDETMPSVMVDAEMLPARTDYFDRIIIIHGLENTENLARGLEQIWRVLKPKGKLLLVVPNEDTPWLKLKTPYRGLQNYSKFKIIEQLNQSKFAIRKYKKGLFFIPSKWMFVNKLTNIIGSIFLRASAGVHIIEAEKLVFGVNGGRPAKIVLGFWDKIFKPKPVVNSYLSSRRMTESGCRHKDGMIVK